MKIIKTPLKWESSTSGSSSGWLISYDDVESAEITVDELTGVSRTGTVDFRQSESEKPGTVAVTQNRVNTYYYVLKTNVETEPVFEFSWEGSVTTVTTDITATTNGFAVKISNPNEAAPKEVTAAPVTKIAELKVSSSEVTFEYAGGSSKEEFKWINWDKSGFTLTRQTTSGHTTGSINSASTTITSVDLVSVSPDVGWITATEKGNIFATSNTGEARSAIITYTYCSKTATVNVTQEGKPEPIIQYFGVKTQSRLANDKAATFTISGESGETSNDVNFSGVTVNSAKYYIAYITATSDSSVSASCNISQDTINVDSPNPLEFPPTGGTKVVTVTTERTQLNVSNLKLKGYTYTGDIDSDNLYEITAETFFCDYEASVEGDDGFLRPQVVSRTATTISAEKNETTSARTGTATFTTINSPTDTPASATVSLSQPHVYWFSFVSTISGSPAGTSGQVSFYKSIGSTTGTPYAIEKYKPQPDGTKHANWSGFVDDAETITYKVDGFESSGTISASTDRVEFNSIGMELSGSAENRKYHISGAKTAVTVSAFGVSYNYDCYIREGEGKSSLTNTTIGVIPHNKELTLNATATTTDKIGVYKSGGTFDNYWVVESSSTNSVTTVNVKYLILRAPFFDVGLNVDYFLGGSSAATNPFRNYSARTTFHVTESAASAINFDGFALSSQTAFWNDFTNLGQVPTGNGSAYTFAFIPPSRNPRNTVENSAGVNRADLMYSTGGSGWNLFYPQKPSDVNLTEQTPSQDGQKPFCFQDYAAKVYPLCYSGDGRTRQGAGKDDTWTLGPLLYRPDDLSGFLEVDGFGFETGNTLSLVKTNATTGGGCTGDSEVYGYPEWCSFTCGQSEKLSAETNYFGFQGGSVSTTNGAISPDKRQWTIVGNGQGGLDQNTPSSGPSFFVRTNLMRRRNFYFQYSATASCPDNRASDATLLSNTPSAMAHVATGSMKTNLLGPIGMKIIYYGRYGSSPGNYDAYVAGNTLRVPASEYVVSPTNPGDTLSVVYDAETGDYIIYDINNVVILKNVGNNYVVVDASELMPTGDEIIDPVDP